MTRKTMKNSLCPKKRQKKEPPCWQTQLHNGLSLHEGCCACLGLAPALSLSLSLCACVCVLIVNYYCNFHCSLHELQLLSSSATMKHTFRIFNFWFTITLNNVKRNLNWDIIKRNVCWDNRQVISQAQATNGRWARCVSLDFQKSYKEVKIKLFWKCLFCERSVLLWSELGVDSLHGAFQYTRLLMLINILTYVN